MKILILNWRDINHPLSGGAEISLLEHAIYWNKMGSEIVWFASSFPNAKKEEVVDGIRYIRRGSHFTVHLWAFIYYLTKKFGKPEIIVDSFHFLPFFTPLYIKKSKVIALINEIAGKVWFENLPYIFALIGYYIEPLFFAAYKNIPFIMGSESAKQELITVGIPQQNCHVVNHGINTVKIDSTLRRSKKPTMVFLGRVSADKGIKDALIAFKKVKQVIQYTQLWIIGKEEKQGLLEDLLKECEVNKYKKNIMYYGYVDQKKKFELLGKSWLLIHPSKKEGWGLNVIEAGIVGTPTVGYNVEGLRDSVKHGKTGILVPAGRADLLADAAIKLIHDKNKYQKYSKNVVAWAGNFTWDDSTKKSWSILKKVYEKKK